MRITARALGAFLALITASCSTATGLVVQDPEPDAATEISTVAFRYEQARRSGGMAGLVESVQQCYQNATVPFTKVWALRECIVLDHAAYLTDVSVGRRVFHDPNPYFADQVYQTRSWTYGKMDGFSSQRQLVNYLLDAEGLLKLDLAQLNQEPIVIHHPLQQQLGRNPFVDCGGVGMQGCVKPNNQ